MGRRSDKAGAMPPDVAADLTARKRKKRAVMPSLVSHTDADVAIAFDALYEDGGADEFASLHQMAWRPGQAHLSYDRVAAAVACKEGIWPSPIQYWQKGLMVHVPPVMATPDGVPFDVWRYANLEIVYLKWAKPAFVNALRERVCHRICLVPSHPNSDGPLWRVLGAPARKVAVFERALIVALFRWLRIGGGEFGKYLASPCWDWPHAAPNPPPSILAGLTTYATTGCSAVIFAGPPLAPLIQGGEGPVLADELIRDWPVYPKYKG
jgi:hypothetical protein